MPGLMSYKLGSRKVGETTNNLRYADDTTLMAESEEELKSLLMRVKEVSGRADIKLNTERNKDHGTQSYYFMAHRGKGGNK